MTCTSLAWKHYHPTLDLWPGHSCAQMAPRLMTLGRRLGFSGPSMPSWKGALQRPLICPSSSPPQPRSSSASLLPPPGTWASTLLSSFSTYPTTAPSCPHDTWALALSSPHSCRLRSETTIGCVQPRTDPRDHTESKTKVTETVCPRKGMA